MTTRPVRARLAAATATLVVLLAATFAISPPAGADHDVSPARLAGDDRFDTAAEIAAFDHPGGSGVALLANGMGYADALASAALSRSTDAPLLLSHRDSLPEATSQAIDDLGVQEVVILGGTAAISAGLEAELDDRVDRVVRFDGATRFETAVRIAESVHQSPNASIGSLDGRRTALIVSSTAPADAVLAGSFAAGEADPFPVLFTEHHRLTPVTEDALERLGIEHAIVVGGIHVVSPETEQRLAQLGLDPQRLGGVDRQHTALLVAEHARGAFGWDFGVVNLVRGDDFADALAAGPHAGRTGAPIVLTRTPAVLGERTGDWFQRECPDVQTVRAIGGTAAVSQQALAEAVDRAEACHAGTTTQQTYIVAPQEPVTGDVGTLLEISVGARYDGEAFTGPVHVSILPCGVADVVGAGGDTFQDDTGDGVVDGEGTSDTGQAAIVRVNGEQVAATGQVLAVEPAADGILEVGVTAEGPDCVVVLVYHDLDGDGRFAVQSDGQAGEPYGVTQFEWR